MSDDLYTLWLSQIDGLSPKKQLLLINSFPFAKAIFNATKYQLSSVKGLAEQDIKAIMKAQDEKYLKEYADCLEESGITFIGIKNEKYPELLRQIPDSPVGIYVIGELPDENLPRVSVIGSRSSRDYGLNVAYEISKGLAQNGVVVVSGMARGIDSMAHKGAIDGGGKTIAVLGCGVDICYPPENKALVDRIKQNGCIISEYYPKTPPVPTNFPRRNRIISGLCAGTVVVEASDRSGTLITTNHALDQGREVMAVPGNVTSSLSKGTNELIKDGAAVVLDYQDVLNVLNISSERRAVNKRSANNTDKTNNNIPKPPLDLEPAERIVYSKLSERPMNIDELIETAGELEAHEVSSVLMMLEIKGYIKKTSGYNYALT